MLVAPAARPWAGCCSPCGAVLLIHVVLGTAGPAADSQKGERQTAAAGHRAVPEEGQLLREEKKLCNGGKKGKDYVKEETGSFGEGQERSAPMYCGSKGWCVAGCKGNQIRFEAGNVNRMLQDTWCP